MSIPRLKVVDLHDITTPREPVKGIEYKILYTMYIMYVALGIKAQFITRHVDIFSKRLFVFQKPDNPAVMRNPRRPVGDSSVLPGDF